GRENQIGGWVAGAEVLRSPGEASRGGAFTGASEYLSPGHPAVSARLIRTRSIMPNIEPGAQGLYDPSYEHDACGVGFIADLKNRKSHQLIQDALQILLNLEHRGACGCEANTGDGAGILIQMPHHFLQAEAAKLGVNLPAQGDYGTGLVFLPQDAQDRQRC